MSNTMSVYTVIDHAGGKRSWVKIGTAEAKVLGEIEIRLDALPINGTMVIRDVLPVSVQIVEAVSVEGAADGLAKDRR